MNIKKINPGDSAQKVADIVYDNDSLLSAGLYESLMGAISLTVNSGTIIKPKLLTYYVYYSDIPVYMGTGTKYRSCKFRCPGEVSLKIEGGFNANVIPVLYFDRYMKLIDNIPLGTTGSPLEVTTPKGTEYVAINIFDHYDKYLTVTFLSDAVINNIDIEQANNPDELIPAGYDISRILGFHQYRKDYHGFIASGGGYAPNEQPAMYVTDYVKVIAGKTLNYKVNLYNSVTCIGLYDKNKKLLNTIAPSAGGFVTGSLAGDGADGVEYIRLSSQKYYGIPVVHLSYYGFYVVNISII